MASEYRNIELSLYYRAWQIALQRGYYIDQKSVPLAASTSTAAPANSYELSGGSYPLVFMDETMTPWPSGVTVRVGGVVQPSGNYSVDYINARITFNAALAGTSSVDADLRTYTIYIREGYPPDEDMQAARLPMVATDVPKIYGQAFGIGSAQKIRTRICTVDIMGRNPGERTDLLDFFERDMQSVQLIDFSEHQLLGRNNNLDIGFSFADQSIERLAQLTSPKGEKINPRPGGSIKERYRALVTFEVENVS